jgi:uncharacterized protein DUF1571/LysM domain-containing protein
VTPGRAVVSVAAALLSCGPLSLANAPTAEARRDLDAMGRAASELRDYTMTLVTQEWDGPGLGLPQTILAKWARPFQVYYKRLCAPHKGREVLFAEGWNGGKLKVSLNTWPMNIRLNLDPHSSLAMGGTRHPVDQTSIVYLVDVVLENFRKADARGEATVEYQGPAMVQGRLCDRVSVTAPWSPSTYRIAAGETLWDVAGKFDLPMAPLLHANRALGWETPSDAKPGQTISVPRYYAGRVDLWIDRGLNLPLIAEIYDGDGVMFERFEHRDLRVNVGLGPMDFSPQNPAYKF